MTHIIFKNKKDRGNVEACPLSISVMFKSLFLVCVLPWRPPPIYDSLFGSLVRLAFNN